MYKISLSNFHVQGVLLNFGAITDKMLSTMTKILREKLTYVYYNIPCLHARQLIYIYTSPKHK